MKFKIPLIFSLLRRSKHFELLEVKKQNTLKSHLNTSNLPLPSFTDVLQKQQRTRLFHRTYPLCCLASRLYCRRIRTPDFSLLCFEHYQNQTYRTEFYFPHFHCRSKRISPFKPTLQYEHAKSFTLPMQSRYLQKYADKLFSRMNFPNDGEKGFLTGKLV